MFLDADDAFLPELMQRVADSLEEHPAQAACWGLVEEYREENGRIVARKEVLCENRVLDGREELRPLVMELERKGLYGYLWNKAYRADYCREINVWIPSQSFNEDEMFNIAFFMDADSLNLLAFAGTRYRKFCRSEGRKRKVQTLTHRYLPDYYPIAMGRVQALLAAGYAEDPRGAGGDLSALSDVHAGAQLRPQAADESVEAPPLCEDGVEVEALAGTNPLCASGASGLSYDPDRQPVSHDLAFSDRGTCSSCGEEVPTG